MVTEHIARDHAEAAPAARQATLDGGSEPVGEKPAEKKPRAPKRSDEQRIADALAEAEAVKARMKAKVVDAVSAAREEVSSLASKAKAAGMAKLAAELEKVSKAFVGTQGLAD